MLHLRKLLAGGSGTALDRLLTYRPALVTVAGSINAALFLAQVLYWWFKSGRRAFYKFNGPCSHERYKEGDSWQEELGMGRSAFENARDSVATKVVGGSSRKEILSFSPVIYWTDSNRVTWYQVNELLVTQLLHAALRIEMDEPQAVPVEASHMCNLSCDQVGEGELSTPEESHQVDQHYLEAMGTSITTPSETTTKIYTQIDNVDNLQGDITSGQEGAKALLDEGLNGGFCISPQKGTFQEEAPPSAPTWWPKALQELRGQMTLATYERLFLGATIQDNGKQVVLVARDPGAAAHLQRWERRICEAIRVSGGGEREFHVT